MSVYDLHKLMAETRRLAAEYRRTTGQTLAVSADLAQYDASRLLKLTQPELPLSGVDAISPDHKIQIKGRVIFDPAKMNQRIGQLNEKGVWDMIYLVLFDEHYAPTAIYAADREDLQHVMIRKSRNARGAMTVKKFVALGKKIWCN